MMIIIHSRFTLVDDEKQLANYYLILTLTKNISLNHHFHLA